MNAWLETEAGMRIPIHSVCSVGRSPRNTLVLNNERVSRRHALIHAQSDGEYWVVDLGSSNGIQLNGKRVVQPTRLQEGDQLEIVGNVFSFRKAKPNPEDFSTGQTTFILNKNAAVSCYWMIAAEMATHGTEVQEPTEARTQQSGAWFLATREIMEHHDASISKFWPEGFLAYWPDTKAPTSQVVEAIKQFLQLTRTSPIPFHFAVHHGGVPMDQAGPIPGGMLYGMEVTFVVKTQKLARTLGKPCVMSEAAAKILKESLPITELGNHSLASGEGSHPFFSL